MRKSLYKEKIRRFEKRMRNLFIYFCCFIFLYSTVLQATIGELRSNFIGNMLGVIICGFLALPIKKGIQTILKGFIKREFAEVPRTKDDKLALELARIFGVFVLYYLTQMGVVLVAFSEFYYIEWNHIRIYTPVFIFNCFLVYIFYKAFIFSSRETNSVR